MRVIVMASTGNKLPVSEQTRSPKGFPFVESRRIHPPYSAIHPFPRSLFIILVSLDS